ncbi:uncharacterized protein LOC129924566 isoform X2 [Biomphalaria glabrata]|uniref:Uncharacterized protein LOC129924566 isoform X2 n=1 Tax=Biomphalaria glabrata TaxID=6526 RepID=A0A9W2ZM62_BIOGL|nr:uncharacterized protein LOC129924566 isoform X2 [Biomphalaria glabrata]
MPLALILKRIGKKMASLQSQRAQCCCCAVGVFTSMFGIFMLSAGICIVLNVTFMEVDTSGLPPELHNEEGKKVVGIILICVSIGALGVSASVSVVYFVICNRKPPPKQQPQQQQQQNQQQHSSGSVSHTAQHGERPAGAETLNGRVAGSWSPHQQYQQHRRPSSRNPNQASVVDRQIRKVLTQSSELPNRSASPQMYSRINSPVGVPPRRVHKSHRSRRPVHKARYVSGLEPHIEEDTEMGKSNMDLQMQERGGEASSQTSSSIASASRQNLDTVHETRFSSGKVGAPPEIIVNAWTVEPRLSDVEVVAETQFYEGAARSVGLLHQQPNNEIMVQSKDISYMNDEYVGSNTLTYNLHTGQGASHELLQDSDEEMDLDVPDKQTGESHHHHDITVLSHDHGHNVTENPQPVSNDLDIAGYVREEASHVDAHSLERYPSYNRDEAESRISFSSVVSSEGGIATGEDAVAMEMMREKMEEILKESRSSC